MLNIKELTKALKQVADEKGLDPEKVLDVIESSIAAAYKKEYGERGEVIKCKLDQKTGELNFWRIKTVVDETTVRFVNEEEEAAAAEEKSEVMPEDDEQKLPRFNPERHITFEEAVKVKPDAQLTMKSHSRWRPMMTLEGSRRKRPSRSFCKNFASRSVILSSTNGVARRDRS